MIWIVYGPAEFRYNSLRKCVTSIDEVEEPWKGYCMMLDAAADENGHAEMDFGYRARELTRDGRHLVWYMFETAFWKANKEN